MAQKQDANPCLSAPICEKKGKLYRYTQYYKYMYVYKYIYIHTGIYKIIIPERYTKSWQHYLPLGKEIQGLQ